MGVAGTKRKGPLLPLQALGQGNGPPLGSGNLQRVVTEAVFFSQTRTCFFLKSLRSSMTNSTGFTRYAPSTASSRSSFAPHGSRSVHAGCRSSTHHHSSAAQARACSPRPQVKTRLPDPTRPLLPCSRWPGRHPASCEEIQPEIVPDPKIDPGSFAALIRAAEQDHGA